MKFGDGSGLSRLWSSAVKVSSFVKIQEERRGRTGSKLGPLLSSIHSIFCLSSVGEGKILLFDGTYNVRSGYLVQVSEPLTCPKV